VNAVVAVGGGDEVEHLTNDEGSVDDGFNDGHMFVWGSFYLRCWGWRGIGNRKGANENDQREKKVARPPNMEGGWAESFGGATVRVQMNGFSFERSCVLGGGVRRITKWSMGDGHCTFLSFN
jgi:hypothetical protein